MKNSTKNIALVFSVALNIGFIVAVIFIYFNHPATNHYGYLGRADKIIQAMDLPAEKRSELQNCLEQFEEEISFFGNSYRQIQIEILTLLAAPKQFDEAALEAVYVRQGEMSQKKRDIVKKHLVLMRKLLGSENSSHFFSSLLKRNS